ncbi:VacJ family lipoprotein [Parvularcula sp. IMCC14364]|uniref:MlaA family lipoprotein n=1 Tax=Parvularcula sp. IMCC14364 TaxID=3067902 RepID=UPI0027414067|nr:VacJ family lipoprotein [Parvularcula sp. IMCC14364]
MAALVLVLTTTACSTLPEDQYVDPYEGWNRKVYNLNDDLDKAVVKPVTQVYVAVTPDPVEKGVSNFYDNLLYPTVALNQFLQGKVEEGFRDMTRFTLNSTLGVVGIFDVATTLGLPEEEEDFGQTFAKWGVGTGPYVVLPVMGGMTLRDGVGRAASMPVNPAFYLEDAEARFGLGAGAAIDTSAQLLEARDLIKGDGYLFVRDTYVQRREFLVNDGSTQEEDPFLAE